METWFTIYMTNSEHTNHSECDHSRQVRLGDTDEWVCEDCMSLMDSENPDVVVG